MSEKEEVMIPTNDYVFRRIFAREGSEKITAKFIESITKHKIKELRLDITPILESDLIDDKIGVLDVYAKGEHTDYDVEMQMANMSNIRERILFYWSKMYLKNIKKGDDYNTLKKTVVILIANENVGELIELEEYHTKWQLREEKHQKTILTDKMEVHIIELSKIEQNIKDRKEIRQSEKELLLWLKFLKEPYKIGGEEMVSSEEVQEAIKILEDLNASEEERLRAEKRLEYIRDRNATEDYGYQRGINDGRADGMKEGIEKGMEKGMEREKLEIAKKKLKAGSTIEFITEITGLSKKEIEKLK